MGTFIEIGTTRQLKKIVIDWWKTIIILDQAIKL